jgi:hypothetical protein
MRNRIDQAILAMTVGAGVAGVLLFLVFELF